MRLTATLRTNEEWLISLKCQNRQAISDLRTILLRGLRMALSVGMQCWQEPILEDFVQEALVRILNSLNSFRGESRFTTWALRIALNVAYTEFRRARWKDISLQDLIEPYEDMDRLSILSDRADTPEQKTAQRYIIAIVQGLIDEELSERQRKALTEVVLDGKACEDVARSMGTNRNSLYKLVYDARKKLRVRVRAKTQLSPQEVLDLF